MSGNWKPKECSLKIGGVEVSELLEFDSDPGDEITQIDTPTDGVTGYQEGWQKPTWSCKAKITSPALQALEDLRTEGDEVTVVFVAPKFTCTITGARINKIKAGGAVKDTWEAAIEGQGKTLKRRFG